MGIFQPAMLVYWRVVRFASHKKSWRRKNTRGKLRRNSPASALGIIVGGKAIKTWCLETGEACMLHVYYGHFSSSPAVNRALRPLAKYLSRKLRRTNSEGFFHHVFSLKKADRSCLSVFDGSRFLVKRHVQLRCEGGQYDSREACLRAIVNWAVKSQGPRKVV